MNTLIIFGKGKEGNVTGSLKINTNIWQGKGRECSNGRQSSGKEGNVISLKVF